MARAVLCVFAAAIIAVNVESADAAGEAILFVLPFAVVSAAFLTNLVWLALARLGTHARPLAAVQIAFDVAFVTGLVYATGGVNSDFLLLYFGPILAAAVVFSRTATLLAASLSTMGLFACTVAYAVDNYAPVLVDDVWLTRQPHTPAALAGVLALQVAAFHLVAFLASTLTMRLRRASIETEQILENMSDGVITLGRDEKVVYANSRAMAILGLPGRESLLERNLERILPPAACQAFRQVIASARPGTIDAEVGPSSLPVQFVVIPVTDHAGRLRGGNVILHDTTERRKLIEATRRADRLEAAATTVASIAHEIRNPLAAIRGSAQELKNTIDLSDPDQRLLDLVVRESDRLNRILTEFLNFSRMPKPQIAPFNLHALLVEVAAQVEMSFPGHSPAIAVSGPSDVVIAADGEQLRQVFVNIALNAVDATEGRGPVKIVIESDASGLSVSTLDRGPGVDEHVKERVFEPFFTTKTTGTGLGLPIAARIVEDHGGRIEVGRTSDNWTCVKVLLPVAEGNPYGSFSSSAMLPAAPVAT